MSWKEDIKNILGAALLPLGILNKYLIINHSLDFGALNEFLINYGADITAAFGLYFLAHPGHYKKRVYSAIDSLLSCSGAESCQIPFIQEKLPFLTSYLPATYDSYDFLAYAAGAGLALAVDLATSRDWRRSRNNLDTRLT